MVNFKLRTIPLFLFWCLLHSRDNNFLSKLKSDKKITAFALNGVLFYCTATLKST